MRISIQTLGSLGDVMPYISLGLELQSRGQDVSLLAPFDFTEHIEGYGLSAAEPAEFYLSEWMATSSERGTLKGPIRFFKDWGVMVRPYVDDVMAACLRASQGADMIIANGISAPSRLAAAAREIPFILTAQQPVISPTRHVPCAMNWRPWQAQRLNRQGYHVVSLALRLMERALKSHRRKLGLSNYPKLHDLSNHLGKPLTKITSVSPAMIAERPEDWAPNDYLTAYPSLPASSDHGLPPDLEAFLNQGSTPLYIGLGSMELDGRAVPIRDWLAQLEGAGRRAILTRSLAAQCGKVPGAHFVADHVPHDLLFPRCLGVLHHGGAGTLDTAIRAGTPQIILPHYLDQFWHADRLHTQGIAPCALSLKRPDTSAFTAAVACIQQPDTQAKAKHLRNEHKSRTGTAEMADIILSL